MRGVQLFVADPVSEDYYVDVTAAGVGRRRAGKATESARASRLRVIDLMNAGLLKTGDEVWFKNLPDQKAVLTADGKCMFESKKMSLLAFGKARSGWGAVNVYEWFIHGPTGKLLEQLRQDLEAKHDEQEASAEAEPEVENT